MSASLPPSDRTMQRASDIVGRRTVVAVVEVVDPSSARDLAQTLGDAAIGGLEVTLRTPRALEAIENASAADSLPVGAGTVLSPTAAGAAVDAGASFLVSPAFDDDVSQRSVELGTPLLPGGVTPNEIHRLQRAGYREAKVFPAASFGGLVLIRSLAAVFPEMSFMPTGGITHANAPDYLAHPNVMAVGGTWIAPRELIDTKNWSEIAKRARAIVDALGADGE